MCGGPPRTRIKNVDLVIVEESERLGPSAMEYLRDQHDRINMGLILWFRGQSNTEKPGHFDYGNPNIRGTG